MYPDEPRVDQALLAHAQHVLGTASARDTLELALITAIKQASRAQAVAGELARFRAGHYSGLSGRRVTGEQHRTGPGGRVGAGLDPRDPGDPGDLGPVPGLVAGGPFPVPAAGCLIDTSALAQSARPDVAAALHTLLTSGAAVTCAILDLEALGAARSAAEYDELARSRRLAYRSVPLTAGVSSRMLDLGDLLARRAHRGRLTPGDLLVAATAMEHGLRLVHHRPAFTLLGELSTLDQVFIGSASAGGTP